MSNAPGIEGYREIAVAQQETSFGVALRRVVTNHNGLQNEGTMLGRLWRRANPEIHEQDQEQNRQQIENFKNALATEYGDYIAETVFGRAEIGLQDKLYEGSNLSSRTIAKALTYADAQRGFSTAKIYSQAKPMTANLFRAQSNGKESIFLQAWSGAHTGDDFEPVLESKNLRKAEREIALRLCGMEHPHSQITQDTVEEVMISVILDLKHEFEHDNVVKKVVPSSRSVQVLQNSGPEERKVAASFQQATRNAGVLTDEPSSGGDAVLVAQNSAILVDRLSSFVKQTKVLLQNDQLDPQTRTHYENLVRASEDRISFGLRKLESLGPIFRGATLEGKVASSEMISLKAAVRVLNEALDTTDNPAPLQLAIYQLGQKIQQLGRLSQSEVPLFEESAGKRIRGAKALALSTIRSAFRKADISTWGTGEKFKQAHIQERNSGPWEPIQRNTTYQTVEKNPKTKTVQTTLIPGCEIPALKHIYPNENSGVCSDDHKSMRSQNLWIDQLTGSDHKTLFTCVRSGVHTVDGVNKVNQDEANLGRLKDAMTATLQSQGLLNNIPLDNSRENPINFSMCDVGLLSSWYLKEKTLQDGHFRTLDQANNTPIQITVSDPVNGDRQVWVKPSILEFNFAVRGYNRDTIGDLLEPSDWTRRNRESIGILLHVANEKLQDESLTEPQRQVVRDLINQIAQMSQNPNDSLDGDFYALASRVIVLADKVGITPNIHCKSGKDRTSRLIEDAKMLAAQIEDTGVVPLPGPLNGPSQKMMTAFALNSGNDEVQRLNTGVAGNMQHNVFENRVNDPLVRSAYRGLQSFART